MVGRPPLARLPRIGPKVSSLVETRSIIAAVAGSRNFVLAEYRPTNSWDDKAFLGK